MNGVDAMVMSEELEHTSWHTIRATKVSKAIGWDPSGGGADEDPDEAIF